MCFSPISVYGRPHVGNARLVGCEAALICCDPGREGGRGAAGDALDVVGLDIGVIESMANDSRELEPETLRCPGVGAAEPDDAGEYTAGQMHVTYPPAKNLREGVGDLS